MNRRISVIVYLPCLLLSVASLRAENASLQAYARGVYAEVNLDQAKAAKEFSAAAQANKRAYDPVKKIAHLHEQVDAVSEALKVISGFADKNPEHVSSQLYAINLLERESRQTKYPTDAVLKRYRQIEKTDPDNEYIISRMISVLENNERHEEALQLYQKKLKSDTKSESYWMAMMQLAPKMFVDRAELEAHQQQAMNKLQALEIKDAAVARYLSDFYRENGREQDAIDVLVKHLDLKPASLTMRTRLGILLIAYNRRAEGREQLEKALKINDRDAQAHSSMAKLLEEDRDMEKSLYHRERALEMSGGSPEDFLEIVMQYWQFDMAKKARVLVEKLIYEKPDVKALQAALGMAFHEEGDQEKAKAAFAVLGEEHKKEDVAPLSFARLQLARAQVFLKSGETDNAELVLKNVVRELSEDDPKNASEALTLLAGSWVERKINTSAAKSLLQRACGLDADNKAAQELLRQINN